MFIIKDKTMALIQIEEMEFFAYHGCYKEERVIGTRFKVDLSIEADTTEAEATDDLHKTINYQAVYKLVKTEMEAESHLLEHVCKRIIDAVYNHYPDVQHVKVKVMKLNPALAAGGKVKQVSVTVDRGISRS
jgi:7,8-dihydroneopterin aldolase/epimerase/oxygenase